MSDTTTLETGGLFHGVRSSGDYSIDSYASHGCIRMHEWDVEELYNWATAGMPIIIKP